MKESGPPTWLQSCFLWVVLCSPHKKQKRHPQNDTHMCAKKSINGSERRCCLSEFMGREEAVFVARNLGFEPGEKPKKGLPKKGLPKIGLCPETGRSSNVSSPRTRLLQPRNHKKNPSKARENPRTFRLINTISAPSVFPVSTISAPLNFHLGAGH